MCILGYHGHKIAEFMGKNLEHVAKVVKNSNPTSLHLMNTEVFARVFVRNTRNDSNPNMNIN